MCPGLGEFKLGRRALGLVIMAAFLSACAWLLVGTYTTITSISEHVKTVDPSLNVPPANGAEATQLVTRLYGAIFTEYQARRDEVHRQLSKPLGLLFILYVYSVVQCGVLGRKRDPNAPAG